MSDAKPTRDSALDFTKGALVLLMILYHSLNHFLGPQGDYYRYLRFITPSFIFITGFLAGNIYLSNRQPGESKFHARLAQRGVKLLVLFTLLNLAAITAFSRNFQDAVVQIRHFVESGWSVYVTGNYPPAQFWVLVPIGYTLAFSSFLLVPCQRYWYFVHGVCVALLLAVGASHLIESPSATLELFTIGLLGVLVGRISAKKIQALVERTLPLLAIYLFYLVAITIWGACYPVQIAAVCANLLLIYKLGREAGDTRVLQRAVVLLGKYSLFGYIFHLAVVHVLSRMLLPSSGPMTRLAVAVALTAMLTWLATETLDRLRRQWRGVDQLYKVALA